MAEQLPELSALESVLTGLPEIAVAVSGGVDSLTLATYAHRLLPQRVAMFHAVSPAVPSEGTERTRMLARREGWRLQVIDAGEFDDPAYMRNPVNRCYHCKTGLYRAMRPHTAAQIVSGTNLDDLGEYRPGLIAAQEHGVRHPFVEAAMSKRQVRALARELGLAQIAELPASPCLSSRVETGIAIDPAVLGAIHAAERLVSETLHPQTVRCRVRSRAVIIELDQPTLAALDDALRAQLGERIAERFRPTGVMAAVGFEVYRSGSAFLHFKSG